MKDDLEGELRQQLKRQLAAHNDHLKDQLEVQHRELERLYQLTMEDKVLEERNRFKSDICASMSKLQVIEGILQRKPFSFL